MASVQEILHRLLERPHGRRDFKRAFLDTLKLSDPTDSGNGVFVILGLARMELGISTQDFLQLLQDVTEPLLQHDLATRETSQVLLEYVLKVGTLLTVQYNSALDSIATLSKAAPSPTVQTGEKMLNGGKVS